MNKKIIITALLLSLGLQANMVSASNITNDKAVSISKESENVTRSEDMQEMATYRTVSGVVTEVENTEGQLTILVGDRYTNGIVFFVEDGTQVIDSNELKWLNAKDIKVGMEVSVVIPKDTPMTMSLPGMCVANDLIIVNTPGKSVETGYFNDELTNESNTLQLNIGNKTTIVSESGKRIRYVAEDLKNKNLVVIYSAATFSIPAQTVPKFVMVMDR